MSKPSKTDLARLEKMTDAEIDTSEIAELDADFFRKAEPRSPARKPVMLQVDEESERLKRALTALKKY